LKERNLKDIEIREAIPNDAELLVNHVREMAAEPDISVPMAPDEFPYTVVEEREILALSRESAYSLFLVAYISDKLVGELTCRANSRIAAQKHVASLGMSVHRDWRGNGIGSMLITHAIDWAKRSNAIHRIELRVFSSNTPAIHLYEKSGFVQEGCLKKAVFRHGKYHDSLMMALFI
jgi:putative acetyltransferase